jgi:hypothetical protein
METEMNLSEKWADEQEKLMTEMKTEIDYIKEDLHDADQGIVIENHGLPQDENSIKEGAKETKEKIKPWIREPRAVDTMWKIVKQMLLCFIHQSKTVYIERS